MLFAFNLDFNITISDLVQSICALGAFILAIFAYWTAKKELKNWKLQKDHEIYLQGLENTLKFVRKIFATTLEFKEIFRSTKVFDDSFIEKLSNSHSKLFQELEILGLFSKLAIFNEMDNKNEKYKALINYYNKVKSTYIALMDSDIFPIGLPEGKTMQNVPELKNHFRYRLDELVRELSDEYKKFLPMD